MELTYQNSTRLAEIFESGSTADLTIQDIVWVLMTMGMNDEEISAELGRMGALQ